MSTGHARKNGRCAIGSGVGRWRPETVRAPSLVAQVLKLRQQLHASEEAAGEDLARAMRRAAAAESVLERFRPTAAALRASRRAADGGRWQAEETLRAAASELRGLLRDMLPPALAVSKRRNRFACTRSCFFTPPFFEETSM